MRPALTGEALRLGRVLAELAADGARGARPGRADGTAGLARRGAGRRAGPAGAADGPEPRRWDRLLIRRGLAGAGACRGAVRAAAGARALRAAGRHRRLPCARRHARRDRLAAHRRAVRRAGAGVALAGGRAQPRGGGGHGLRAGGGAGAGGRAGRRAVAAAVPVAAQRARRPAGQARPRARKRVPSSSAPPAWRATRASASCCCERARAMAS